MSEHRHDLYVTFPRRGTVAVIRCKGCEVTWFAEVVEQKRKAS